MCPGRRRARALSAGRHERPGSNPHRHPRPERQPTLRGARPSPTRVRSIQARSARVETPIPILTPAGRRAGPERVTQQCCASDLVPAFSPRSWCGSSVRWRGVRVRLTFPGDNAHCRSRVRERKSRRPTHVIGRRPPNIIGRLGKVKFPVRRHGRRADGPGTPNHTIHGGPGASRILSVGPGQTRGSAASARGGRVSPRWRRRRRAGLLRPGRIGPAPGSTDCG